MVPASLVLPGTLTASEPEACMTAHYRAITRKCGHQTACSAETVPRSAMNLPSRESHMGAGAEVGAYTCPWDSADIDGTALAFMKTLP